jgi:hypothetical protein
MDAAKDDLFEEMAQLLHEKRTDEVVPVLITAAARALVIESRGELDRLSTLLIRFCRLLENEAADMIQDDKIMQQ